MRSNLAFAFLLCCTWASAQAAPGDVDHVSVDYAPEPQPNWFFTASRSLSADGRYALFDSDWPAFVRNDTNGVYDVFVRDRANGTTIRASVGAGGVQANGRSFGVALSADGRHVLFQSDATNLVPGVATGSRDLFLRDLNAGSSERVNLDSSGQVMSRVGSASMSADARYVAFGVGTVYVRDRLNRVTVAMPIAQTQGGLVLSPDGRYVAVSSWGRALLYDRVTGRQELISRSSAGVPADATSYAHAISADNCCIVFVSRAGNLAPGNTGGIEQVYLRDRTRGTTERISIKADGSPFPTAQDPAISADGRFVAFASWTRSIGQYVVQDIYVRDRTLSRTEVVTRNADGVLAHGTSKNPVLSPDGRYVLFTSDADNLVAADADSYDDIFVKERAVGAVPSFSLSTRTLDFGSVTVGARTAHKSITVANTGSAALNITWVGLGGGDGTQFQRVRHCPEVLPVGTSCTADVAFAPSSVGPKQAKLIVSIGVPGAARSVALLGEAVALP